MVNVSCPNCQATYQLDPSKLADGGRKLKCARCGTVWVARAEEPATPAPQPAPAAESPSGSIIPPQQPAAPVEKAEDALSSAQVLANAEATPAPPAPLQPEPPSGLPPSDNLIQRTPGVEDLTQVGGWRNLVRGGNLWRTGAMGFIALGLLAGAFLLWPVFFGKPGNPEEPAPKAVAKPETAQIVQPPAGVILHRVRGEVGKLEDGEGGKSGGVALTVRGLLTNTTSATLEVPPMRLELLGTNGQVADMWPVTNVSSTLAPAAEQAWSVSLSAPDMSSVHGWRVVFVNKVDAPPAEMPVETPPSPTEPATSDKNAETGHSQPASSGH